MEKTSHVLRICGCKALSMVALCIFYLNIISAQCSSGMSQHVSNEPPLHFREPNFKNKFRTISLSVFFGIVTGLMGALLFASVIRCFTKFINRNPILKGPVVFSPKIPSKTLKSALSNDPQLLGSSPIAKYYKVVLDNGLTVAVKRLELFDDCSPEVQSKGTKKKIEQELKVLSGLRHENLMSLRAYTRELCGYSLVYDYVATGSLEDVTKRVRENQLELKWEIRLRIASGIVKGLHYLHFTCEPRRLHYNLKPSNVILDSEFKPRLADCGLTAVIPNLYRPASGYNAPECIQNCRYTDKSDVFSFGVILGVLLTGRDPLDPFFGEARSGGSLCQWLRHLQQAGEAREALDKSILGKETEEGEMLMAIRIVVVCLSDMPADRPSSDELVSMLSQLNSF